MKGEHTFEKDDGDFRVTFDKNITKEDMSLIGIWKLWTAAS